MIFYIVLGSSLCAALAGLAAKAYADRHRLAGEITWREFWLGVGLITAVIAPATTFGLYKLAQASRATYREFWNGHELAVVADTTRCYRDGPCVREYRCDPYTVRVPYSDCRTVGSGKNARTVCTTKYRTETRYHDCPYCDFEVSYRVATTLGNYWIDTGRLPANPDAHRWRAWRDVPSGIASGDPSFWSAARARVDSGRPGPVTKTVTYDNYILASELNLLKQWSGHIEELDSLGLLPDIRTEVYQRYRADKVRFVGFRPPNATAWSTRLEYLNAALGADRQGDLRLVVILDRTRSLNPDQYSFALKAHWQNSERFGRDALPKNAVLVVVGTHDGARVAWARATTGMPVGNEALETAARVRLPGVRLEVDSLLGTTHGVLAKGSVRSAHGSGALEDLLYGLRNPDTRFSRVSMNGGDSDDVGTGYLYLKGEIRPSRGALVGVFFGVFVACLPVWWIMLVIGQREGRARVPFGGGPALRGRSMRSEDLNPFGQSGSPWR